MRPKLSGTVSLGMVAMLGIVPMLYAAEEHKGTVKLGELNCTACHSAAEIQTEWISPKAAPILMDIGNRVSPEWLQRYLTSPEATMAGTTMPDMLHGDAEQAEALTHYLLSAGKSGFRRVMPDRAAVARGESLYHSIGCVACHAPQNGAAIPPDSVTLPVMEDKWAFDGLKKFLLNPLATLPSGRMPAMHLTDSEAGDVAHYLLSNTPLSAPAELAFYQGRIRSLENLDSAVVARTAPLAGLMLEGPMCDPKAAFRITTWIDIKEAGEYTFFLKTIGASRLSVAGRWILGEESWETGKVDENYQIDLLAGRHELKLDYVQRGKDEAALSVEWKGPGFERQSIPAARMSSVRQPIVKPSVEVPVFTLDPAKVEKGRGLYSSLNCATCHEGKPVSPSLPDLTSMNPTRGCLSERPTGAAPDFHLDPQSREEIREALVKTKAAPPVPKERVALTMSTFRCVSCHVRDGSPGILPERAAFFTSNVDDLGDQGRVPPNLDGVGDKLRPEWLQKVLAEGAGVRPYLNTRMPQFGAANVGHLADLFVSLDRQAQPVPACADSPEVQKEAGRKLVGTDGLSCIACHRFNGQPAHSMQVLDLTSTPGRLNEDWFRRFLRDPNTFQPGTRMPALWPNGRSLLPTLLDGDTDRQHAALWTYLGDGSKAKFPEGLSRKSMEIIVGGEAVVYRGKLWESGFRTIATAYPGQLNVAFDSEDARLASVWRGRFLDASAHWSNQGMGSIRPLGTDIILFPHGSPFAVLADVKSPWPTGSGKEVGMKFGGYQVDALKRPILLYSFGNLHIEDHISSTDLPSLHRTIKFAGPAPGGLHFRLAQGKLAAAGENAWRLNGELTITVTGGGKAFIRGKGEQTELLVPVSSAAHNPQLEIDYVW